VEGYNIYIDSDHSIIIISGNGLCNHDDSDAYVLEKKAKHYTSVIIILNQSGYRSDQGCRRTLAETF